MHNLSQQPSQVNRNSPMAFRPSHLLPSQLNSNFAIPPTHSFSPISRNPPHPDVASQFRKSNEHHHPLRTKKSFDHHRPLRHVKSSTRISHNHDNTTFDHHPSSTSIVAPPHTNNIHSDRYELISSKSSIRFVLEEGKKQTPEEQSHIVRPRQNSIRIRYAEDPTPELNELAINNHHAQQQLHHHYHHHNPRSSNMRLTASVIDLGKSDLPSYESSSHNHQNSIQLLQHQKSHSSRELLLPISHSGSLEQTQRNLNQYAKHQIPSKHKQLPSMGAPSLFKSNDLPEQFLAKNANKGDLIGSAQHFGFKSAAATKNLNNGTGVHHSHESSHFFSQGWNSSETRIPKGLIANHSNNNNNNNNTHQQNQHIGTSTLYQQYMKRLIDNQVGSNSHSESLSFEQPLMNSFRKTAIKLPMSVQHTPNSKRSEQIQQHSSLQNQIAPLNPVSQQFTCKKDEEQKLSSLRFPASQKDLQEFNRAQEQNQLRFARSNENNKREEFLEEVSLQKHLQNGHSPAQNPEHHQQQRKSNRISDSLRIMELTRERNHVLQFQKLTQEKNSKNQEKQRNEQFETLVQESIVQSNQNSWANRTNSNMRMTKRDKQGGMPSLIVINDVSEITKSRHHIGITQQDVDHPSSSSVVVVGGGLSGVKIRNSEIGSNGQTTGEQGIGSTPQMNQRGSVKRFKTMGSIKVGENEAGTMRNFMMQKDVSEMEEKLQRETKFVDELQQAKIQVREALETYLTNRPKLLKLISRNCLMDQEQLIFFLMNFLQFCIDDMFSAFKKKYAQRISAILEGNNAAGGITATAAAQHHNKGENWRSDLSPEATFKFTQKIPEDIISELTEAIQECLEVSEKITQKSQLSRFYENISKNVVKYILPQTVIDRMGGFVRLRQLIVGSLKTLNNYINSASKLNHVEESDDNLVDKHLMPVVCALINDDIETLRMQINLFKTHNNVMSSYDFFTIKKMAWDIMGAIKLDHKLKFQVILQIENLRYEIFENPFQARLKMLGSSMMKSYEVCNYFRNPSANENHNFLAGLMKVLYQNGSYTEFISSITPKLKFGLNDRFFDFLQKFLLEELKETDSKSLIDVQIRITKLRIKAGLTFNFFSLIENGDSDAFFTAILPFLQAWMQKYNLSNTVMDAKAQDFKFLELFVKWALNKQDLFSVMDSEPSLMHYVVNEFMLSFWIKGIIAFLESRGVPKAQYKYLIQFISLYLLFKKDPNEPAEKQEEGIKDKDKVAGSSL